MLKLLRFENLVMVAISQILIGTHFHSQNLYSFIAATTLCMISANSWNDLLDVETDRINAKKNLFSFLKLNRRLYISILVFLNILSILIVYDTPLYLITVLICQTLLIVYNYYLKKIFFLGNILVATVSVLALLAPVLASSSNPVISPFYIIFSSIFILQFNREIIKDVEDVKGDFATNYHTAIIELGTQRVKSICKVINLFYIFNLLYCALWINTEDSTRMYICLFLIPLGLLQQWKLNQLSSKKSNPIQRLFKLNLCFGILILFL